MGMERTTVKLSKLTPGPNARSDIKTVNIDDLLASIPAFGLINPLVVTASPDGKKYEVRAGGRRLRALKKLYAGEAKSFDVPVIIIADDEKSDSLALADNIARKAIHPVDEYRQYADLVARGLSTDDIERDLGVPAKWVRQRLQLAKLAPDILEQWRKGKIRADQAEALSILPDHDKQVAVWKLASQHHDRWSMEPGNLKRSMLRDLPAKDSPELKLIGPEAYEAAGGRFTEDLFFDERHILDAPILRNLVKERLNAECVILKEQGWGWAMTGGQLGSNWHLPKMTLTPWATAEEVEALASGPWDDRDAIRERIVHSRLPIEEKAKAGVLVDIGGEGEIVFQWAMLHADEYEEPGSDDDPDDGPDEHETATGHPEPETSSPPVGKVNFALRADLAERLSRAIGDVISMQPIDAAAALFATIEQQVRGGFGSKSPIAIDASTWGPNQPDMGGPSIRWEKEFKRWIDMTTEAMLVRAGELVGLMIDVRQERFDPKQWSDPDRFAMLSALAEALDPKALTDALLARFDPADYFSRLRHDKIQAIIREMGHLPANIGGKGANAALAARLAQEKQWMPPEWRAWLSGDAPGAAGESDAEGE
jgi:ParB/RepB/Spo0J family partition protein